MQLQSKLSAVEHWVTCVKTAAVHSSTFLSDPLLHVTDDASHQLIQLGSTCYHRQRYCLWDRAISDLPSFLFYLASDLVSHVAQGYRASIFTTGPTSLGKTISLFAHSKSLIMQCAQTLFQMIQSKDERSIERNLSGYRSMISFCASFSCCLNQVIAAYFI